MERVEVSLCMREQQQSFWLLCSTTQLKFWRDLTECSNNFSKTVSPMQTPNADKLLGKHFWSSKKLIMEAFINYFQFLIKLLKKLSVTMRSNTRLSHHPTCLVELTSRGLRAQRRSQWAQRSNKTRLKSIIIQFKNKQAVIPDKSQQALLVRVKAITPGMVTIQLSKFKPCLFQLS